MIEPPTWKYQFRASKLSPRENDCVRLLAAGHHPESIAINLGIAQRTVRFHVDNAKVKLNAGTRCQLVAEAIRKGEID